MSDVREDILDNIGSDCIEILVHKTENSNGLEYGLLCDISDLSVTLQKTLESFKYFLTENTSVDDNLRVYIRQGEKIMAIGNTVSSNIKRLNYYLKNIGGKLYKCDGTTISLYDSSSIENIVLDFD